LIRPEASQDAYIAILQVWDGEAVLDDGSHPKK